MVRLDEPPVGDPYFGSSYQMISRPMCGRDFLFQYPDDTLDIADVFCLSRVNDDLLMTCKYFFGVSIADYVCTHVDGHPFQ